MAQHIVSRVKVGDSTITLVNIKKSINQVLKDNFSDVKLYAEEVEEGFAKPSFFTQIIPIYSNHDTTNYSSNKLMIVINYFSKNETELENLKMVDELKKAFGMTLKVGSRYLTLQNIEADTTDGVLQFKFDLNFFDGVETTKEEGYEAAGELKINLKE